MKTTALKTQIGGEHYKVLEIQPVEYIMANQLDFCSGNVIKYISRFRRKSNSLFATAFGN